MTQEGKVEIKPKLEARPIPSSTVPKSMPNVSNIAPANTLLAKKKRARDEVSPAVAYATATKVMLLNRAAAARKANKSGRKCNCKRSGCLKLYCECFAAGIYCDHSCNCVQCMNNPDNEALRINAIDATLARNPDAFRPKVKDGIGATPRHLKGCNCRKSGCLKKYCECFQAGILCGDNCKCQSCKNTSSNSDRQLAIHRAELRGAKKQRKINRSEMPKQMHEGLQPIRPHQKEVSFPPPPSTTPHVAKPAEVALPTTRLPFSPGRYEDVSVQPTYRKRSVLSKRDSVKISSIQSEKNSGILNDLVSQSAIEILCRKLVKAPTDAPSLLKQPPPTKAKFKKELEETSTTSPSSNGSELQCLESMAADKQDSQQQLLQTWSKSDTPQVSPEQGQERAVLQEYTLWLRRLADIAAAQIMTDIKEKDSS